MIHSLFLQGKERLWVKTRPEWQWCPMGPFYPLYLSVPGFLHCLENTAAQWARTQQQHLYFFLLGQPTEYNHLEILAILVWHDTYHLLVIQYKYENKNLVTLTKNRGHYPILFKDLLHFFLNCLSLRNEIYLFPVFHHKKWYNIFISIESASLSAQHFKDK